MRDLSSQPGIQGAAQLDLLGTPSAEGDRGGGHAPPAPVAPLSDAVGPKHRKLDPGTSRVAAERAKGTRASTRHRILEAMQSARRAVSYDELAQRTGIAGVTVSTRLSECARMGLIVSPHERTTASGGKAKAWTLTHEGHRWLNADRAVAA